MTLRKSSLNNAAVTSLLCYVYLGEANIIAVKVQVNIECHDKIITVVQST